MQVLTTDAQMLSPTEKAERVADYRRLGFERRAPAQIVYQGPNIICPWPGCGMRIDGIHFELDRWLDKSDLNRLLESWWKGPGLVGQCPKCGQAVLFSIEGKKTIDDVKQFATSLLPQQWTTKAHIVTKTNS